MNIAIALMLSLLASAFAFDDVLVADHMELKCANQCRLNLCSNPISGPIERPAGNSNFLQGQNLPMGGSICANKKILLNVKTKEALVRPKDSSDAYQRISTYSPAGVTTPYVKKYFFTTVLVNGDTRIARKRGTIAQYRALDDHCVTIPIKAYNPTMQNGEPGERIVTSNPRDCISMRVVAPKVVFQLSWNNTDDFDLIVIEPEGDMIDKTNMKVSSGGELQSDNGRDRCDLPTELPGETMEAVRYRYDDDVQSGTYNVRVVRAEACGKTNASFTLRIIEDGVIKKSKTRIANASFRKKTFTFKNAI